MDYPKLIIFTVRGGTVQYENRQGEADADGWMLYSEN